MTAMRGHGPTVHASDIEYRGCPDSTVLDFLEMTDGRRLRCAGVESALRQGHGNDRARLRLGFRVVILLLKANFAEHRGALRATAPRGHLRRVHVLAERLQDMHDANSRCGWQEGQPVPGPQLVRV